MSLVGNLAEIERTREAYWSRYPVTSPIRLRWRAQAVRHALHVTPGASVLELGAGGGLWTKHIVDALPYGCRVTAVAFNADLADRTHALALRNTEAVHVRSINDLPLEGFDCVIGTAILSHDRFGENVAWIQSLLRPGGSLLFFEANRRNPQVLAKARSRRIARWSGNAECQIALDKPLVLRELRRGGLDDIHVVPYDILHPRTPAPMVSAIRSAAFVAEHTPGLRELCGTLFIHGRKPNAVSGPDQLPDLAVHHRFRGAVSVVVPCFREARNIPRLVDALRASYDSYLREVIFVNDESGDGTAQIVGELAREDPRIRLIQRAGRPGVGLALRDGYAATTGEYVLSLDCDFAVLVPELQDLFDVLAAGHEGAIGSRFSQESVLLDYPVAKMIGNRAFHLLVRMLLRLRVRDISNNLKLYRGDIMRALEIEEPGFAANAETGLKPLLAGRDIKEVPIAWVDRKPEMGKSSFGVASAAPAYVAVLGRALLKRSGPSCRR